MESKAYSICEKVDFCGIKSGRGGPKKDFLGALTRVLGRSPLRASSENTDEVASGGVPVPYTEKGTLVLL